MSNTVGIIPCAEKLKIISHPQRLKILSILAKDILNVTDLNSQIDIPQNLLSYHLKVLEDYGFIRSERSGKNIIYQSTHNLTFENNKLNIDLNCCELKF